MEGRLWRGNVLGYFILIKYKSNTCKSLLQFKESPLLLNRESETGLTDSQYKTLLTGQKLQDISTKFVTDVADYFWEMAKISGKVVGNGISSGNQS